jgi:hypothetical protein
VAAASPLRLRWRGAAARQSSRLHPVSGGRLQRRMPVFRTVVTDIV